MNKYIHKGGCLCGHVRYETQGQSELTGVCHCRYCQLRTGSAFATLIYFPLDRFEITLGYLRRHEFLSESQKRWQTNFCEKCGSTVFIELEIFDGLIGVEAGTFDPPTFWFDVANEVFIRSKAHFVGDIVTMNKDDTFFSYAPKSGENPRLSSSLK